MKWGRWTPDALAGLVVALTVTACAAPISTIRSPFHLRVIEVRNDSDRTCTLKIEPVKVLYLYHGFDYDFRILDAPAFSEITRVTVAVERDLKIEFSGDSLSHGVKLLVRLGKATSTFADAFRSSIPLGFGAYTRSSPTRRADGILRPVSPAGRDDP